MISQFFGPYKGSGSLFSRSVPCIKDPCVFSVDLTRLGGLLAWAIKKKNFQNIPQNRLVGKYFYYHDGHILKNWRKTGFLEEIALEVDHLTFEGLWMIWFG